MPKTFFSLKLDVPWVHNDTLPLRPDALAYRNGEQVVCGKIDFRARTSESWPNLFDAFRIGAIPQILNAGFHAAAMQPVFVRNRLDSLRFDKTGGLLKNRFDATVFQNSREPVRYHAVNDFPSRIGRLCSFYDSILFQNSKEINRYDVVNDFPVGIGRLASSYDSLLSVFGKTSNRFQILSDYVARIQSGRFPARFYIGKSASGFQPVRFNVLPQEFLAFFRNQFDSTSRGLTLHPTRKQAFVKPGWRIVAKDILTNEIHNLGFIDADSGSPAIEDVFLPDGEYEISVLTSSLFWKDASDFGIRLLTIRPGEEVSPLPTIYNLRSSISQGETTIHWSAGKNEIDDCVFGIWYFSASPVPTDGPPSETVWYSPELIEYQTSFRQFAPCYVAVAAMRPGNEPEIGKIHELYLDWKSTPPRPPDDVVVLDRFQASDGRIPEDLRPPGEVYFENF